MNSLKMKWYPGSHLWRLKSITPALKNWFHDTITALTTKAITLKSRLRYCDFINKVLCWYLLFLIFYTKTFFTFWMTLVTNMKYTEKKICIIDPAL
jgi:hypothetical protein